ncbi:MAG: hypothetical protein ABJA77_02625 [Variovorax sp.]
MSTRSRFATTLCSCAVLLGSFAASAQAAANPPIRVAQGVEYMCGGANRDEAEFLKMVSPRWSTTLEFAVNRGQRGAFPVPVQVKVRDRYNGHAVMQAEVEGPLMLARLEPGAYEVEASVGGVSVVQQVTVIGGYAASALFLFPSNVDFATLAHPPRTLAQGQ